MWYLYNQTKDVREFEELWFKYSMLVFDREVEKVKDKFNLMFE